MLDSTTDSYFGVAEAQRPYMVHELKYPDRKVRIIYNGVDPGLFDTTDDRSALAEFNIPVHEKVVGIVAALRPEKDHATFLRAARMVLDVVPDVAFLVVGDGPTRAALEKLCTQLGISRNVHFVGTRSDVDRLLRSMNVFALSSNTVECFPMALLEAMACARPAVCTDVGGIPEMIEHGVSGYLVPPNQPGLLASRLIDLLNDANAARAMGRAGRRRVEIQFSLARSVEAAEQAIEDVMQRRHGLSRGRVGQTGDAVPRDDLL